MRPCSQARRISAKSMLLPLLSSTAYGGLHSQPRVCTLCYKVGFVTKHISLLYTVLEQLAKAILSLNLAKCEFGQAKVT